MDHDAARVHTHTYADVALAASRAAERAALREELADALAPREDPPASPAPFPSPSPSRGARRVGRDESSVRSGFDPATEGELLCWGLFLRHVAGLDPGSPSRERLVEYARVTKAVPRLMARVSPSLPLPSEDAFGDASKLPEAWRALVDASAAARSTGGAGRGAAAAAAEVDPLAPSAIFAAADLAQPRRLRRALRAARLAVGLYRVALRALPAATRVWFGDLRERGTARALAAATAAAVSPALLDAEFAAVELASSGGYGGGGLDDAGELTVKASRGAREVTARYEIDDAALELVIRLPASYPLASAELECVRASASPRRMRKWMLGVSAILQHRNGAVAEGLMLWRKTWMGNCRGGTVSHLLPRHPRHEPSDPEAEVPAVPKQVSQRVPVQVVHQLEQEHVSAVPDAVGASYRA